MSVWNRVNLSQNFAELPAAFYAHVTPTPLLNPQWVMWNEAFATELNLPNDPELEPELLLSLSGQTVPDQFSPLAMKYAGHQFGVYNPQLGDGRGLWLAEITDNNHTRFDIHIKGAGTTPYSRQGDGRAVLRSTIREYLCSEAMHGLGIPTTRALGMMNSETPVYREQVETGAMLVRLAETHIRFGHFEHFFYTQQLAEQKLLADKVIEWHFPECADSPTPYLALFEQIVIKTAELIAYWQAYGFAHGVMNTDNMSVLGQTFDYGPYAFLDDYEPSFICNHSDYQGRYAFNQQPNIALWNLSALAHSFSALVEKPELEEALSLYEPVLSQNYSRLMRAKIGLETSQDGDSELFQTMFNVLTQNHVDHTRFFRQLSELDRTDISTVSDLFLDRITANQWLNQYIERCNLESADTKTRCQKMRTVNPKYILRNYLAQEAIAQAEQGDFSKVETLAQLLKRPFDEQPEFEDYAKLPPEWGKKMEISCSS